MSSEEKARTALSRLTEVTDQILNGKSISQYGALCVRASRKSAEPRVLLITSRDTGRWVIPKGWGMRDRDPHEVAEREAWEEAGVIGDAEKEPCGFYTYVKSLGKGARVPAIVQVHVLHVERLGRKFPEKGERRLRWFRPHEASAAVAEPELRGLLSRIPRLLITRGDS
ncbi:NUDIX hydrolase [Agrobacterium rubi]|uniref:NUDIX hydrolase n=1 Tax=Agrobacterium rubi TaxID=28099 RepID=A0ABX2JA99_9HYPH|nr:NUDIX hydrolase [Agrobacterium rubi]NTE89336.1 NUDIX hydrolase [Agrobacterium rubi]NTF39472.1 NUDIX hydrolase [Agrobacterium rubi]